MELNWGYCSLYVYIEQMGSDLFRNFVFVVLKFVRLHVSMGVKGKWVKWSLDHVDYG